MLAFVNMTNGNTIARNVVGGASVNMTNGNTSVGNVMGGAFVTMATISIHARNVMGGAFVNMEKIDSAARIVVVACCARPHIVLPQKVKSMMDTVCFALSICFRISLLHGIIG